MGTPQLYFQPGGIAELIMQKCPELKLPFSPTIWAPDPHTQSAMGRECPSCMQCQFQQHQQLVIQSLVRKKIVAGRACSDPAAAASWLQQGQHAEFARLASCTASPKHIAL